MLSAIEKVLQGGIYYSDSISIYHPDFLFLKGLVLNACARWGALSYSDRHAHCSELVIDQDEFSNHDLYKSQVHESCVRVRYIQ